MVQIWARSRNRSEPSALYGERYGLVAVGFGDGDVGFVHQHNLATIAAPFGETHCDTDVDSFSANCHTQYEKCLIKMIYCSKYESFI